MFVISLLSGGRLKLTAIRTNANDAVELAQSWYKDFKEEYAEGGYIAIDQQIKGADVNVRFAEISFDQSPDEAKLYLNLTEEGVNKPIFSSKFLSLSKVFLISFLEFGLVRLTEYIIEKNKRGKE